MILDMSSAAEKRPLLDMIRQLSGLHRVEIVRYRERRTDRQNRFYWPAIVQPFADFLREQGEQYTDEMAHELLKFKFLRQTIPDLATGEVIGERVRSTTELTVQEFAEYVDQCVAYLAETFGITVAMPDRSEA